jgi:ATP-dependent helicase HrpA
LLAKGRRALAEGLARGDARHVAAKNDRIAVEEIRESWRRSGGKTPKLDRDELAAIYEKQLVEQNVRSYSDFRRARLGIDAESILPSAEREKYLALPDYVEIRGREVPIRYDVEESNGTVVGVARLQLPEKIARTLSEQELPRLDRPLRFVVPRGARGAARADNLDALREELDRPFTDEELAELDRQKDRQRRGEEERRRGPRTPYGGTARSKRPAPKHKARDAERGGRGGKRQGGPGKGASKRGRKRR